MSQWELPSTEHFENQTLLWFFRTKNWAVWAALKICFPPGVFPLSWIKSMKEEYNWLKLFFLLIKCDTTGVLLHRSPNYFGNSRRLYILEVWLSVLISFDSLPWSSWSIPRCTQGRSGQEKSMCHFKKCLQKIKVSIFQFSLAKAVALLFDIHFDPI